MSDFILFVVVVAFLWSGFCWLIRRHPLVAIFLVGFLRALLGGRR
jgi:hypothetical protein